MKEKDNILMFDGCTSVDVPPERVLRGAEDADLKNVIVLGETDDDFYLASSLSDIADILLLIEQIKFKLLRGDYTGEEEDDEEYEI